MDRQHCTCSVLLPIFRHSPEAHPCVAASASARSVKARTAGLRHPDSPTALLMSFLMAARLRDGPTEGDEGSWEWPC